MPEVVWEAFRALRRYVAAPSGTLRVGATWTSPASGKPAALVEEALPLRRIATKPARTNLTAAQRIASTLQVKVHTHPLDVPDDYYAYLYLWAQVLRVSRAYHPHHLNAEVGWKNLMWRPLPVLAGAGDKAHRMWAKWYYTNIQAATVKPTEADLRRLYPWPPETQKQTADILELQLDALTAAMAKYGMDAGQIFATCNRFGEPKRHSDGANHQWLPLLIAARPESYRPLPTLDGAAAQRGDVVALLRQVAASPRRLTTFLKFTVPYCNPEVDDDQLDVLRSGLRAGLTVVIGLARSASSPTS